MSAGPGRREVAIRCFAAEYDDADYEYSESDEERAPNYVVTPTGARINRLFVVGVLTEVEPVSDDVLRARVVDPTGAFVVYAGQYQPDAKTFLERAEPPEFVAVTGKARTFEPDDGDVVYTSVRPESIATVDAATRDRWTVQAAEQTIDRVSIAAAARSRAERGEALREVLLQADVDPALAAGIPRAIDHYGTTEAYLAAIRSLALEAAEVVAGEREEVGSLAVAPDEDGTVDVDLAGDVDLSGAEPVAAETEGDTDATATVEPETTTGDEAGMPTAEEPGVTGGSSGPDSADAESPAAEDGRAPAADGSARDPAVVEPEPADPEPEAPSSEAAPDTPADVDTDEVYELDDDERAEIEEEFGTEFETGSEVDAPGEADIETPGPGEETGAAEEPREAAPTEDEAAAGGGSTGTDDEADEPGTAAAETEAPADDVDLEDAAVEAMAELDDGDGADRQAVIDAVATDRGADEAAVAEAIQSALMGGRCYEPEDDRLKAI